MVVAKWKEAVLHIREEERQMVLEEERRRGHEHLDDILTRSGQILEAQQAELGKTEMTSSSRSQSSSLVTTPLPWTTSPDGSDDEDLGADSDNSDATPDSDDEEDVDTAGLLGSTHSASVTPAPDESTSSRNSLAPTDPRSSRSATPSHGSLELLMYPEDTDVSSPIELEPLSKRFVPDPFTEPEAFVFTHKPLQPFDPDVDMDEVQATPVSSTKEVSFADELFHESSPRQPWTSL
ncbi:hypothetical protein QCA50_004900 [Cerrena zonata]|uniref:Uncharacterized protein n=1 Tax=Cerrena zonata TaxID=2478898 RepID=A0AAW0GPS3_9APHY